MCFVVNLRKQDYTVYIGRAGKGKKGYFGNPIIVGKLCPIYLEVHFEKGETLSCFKLLTVLKIQRDKTFELRVINLKGEVLGCFCKPKPCHGDFLAKMCVYLNKRGKNESQGIRK